MKEIIGSHKSYIMKEEIKPEEIKHEGCRYAVNNSPYYDYEANMKQIGIKEELKIDLGGNDCYTSHHSVMNPIRCSKYDEEIEIPTRSSHEISYTHLENHPLGNSVSKHKDHTIFLSDKHNFVQSTPVESYIQRTENEIIGDIVSYHSLSAREVHHKQEVYHRPTSIYYKVRSLDSHYAVEEKLVPEIPLNYTITENLSHCSHENVSEAVINCVSHEIPINCRVPEAPGTPINCTGSDTPINCTGPGTQINCTGSETTINCTDSRNPLGCIRSETPINCSISGAPINCRSSETSIHCSGSETTISCSGPDNPLHCNGPGTPINCSVPESCICSSTIINCSGHKSHVNSVCPQANINSNGPETSLNCTDPETALHITDTENNFSQSDSAEHISQCDPEEINTKKDTICNVSDHHESLKLSNTDTNDGTKGMENNFINFLSQFFPIEKDSQNCEEAVPCMEETGTTVIEQPCPEIAKPSSPRNLRQTKVKTEYQGDVNHKLLDNYFQCCKCTYAGRTLALLKRHEMSHLENKRFQCSKCSYSTNFNSYLKEHEMTHSNIRPFKCSHCNFASKLKSNIKKHERTHLKDKKISRVRKLQKCSQCDFSTTFKTHMEKHQLSHVELNSYKCFDCDFETQQKYLLESHRKIHLNM